MAAVSVGALIFAYRVMSKERAAEAEREKPVASESNVSRNVSGEIVLTLDSEAQRRIALKVTTLPAAQHAPEVKGFGRVLDPEPLSLLFAKLASIRATAEASQREWKRLKMLSAQDNTSARALQTTEAAAQRDHAELVSGQHRFLLTWGRALADRKDLAELVQSLATGENALVRIDLLAGELLKTRPLGARLFAFADENNGVDAELIGTAPAVDAQTQGQGFLFLVKSSRPGFAPGGAVVGYLKVEGEVRNGVVIPLSAVTRFGGKPWIFVQTGDDTFLRREIALETPADEGWFTTRAIKPGERVVVSGAQMLLSEEQKYQIHMGD